MENIKEKTRITFDQQMKNMHNQAISSFANHKVTLKKCKINKKSSITIIDWRQPNTNVYSIRYIICGGHLYVSGDMGAGVYCWYTHLTTKFLAELDLSYFISKCIAGDNNHRKSAKDWYQNKVEDFIEDQIKEIDKDDKDYEDKINALNDAYITESTHSYEEWCNWLRDNGDEVLGSDCFEYCEVGYGPALRTIYHFVGLRLLHQQLIENEQKRFCDKIVLAWKNLWRKHEKT